MCMYIGHGTIIMRAETHTEIITSNTKSGISRARDAIVVTKLPYMTNKAGRIAICSLFVDIYI